MLSDRWKTPKRVGDPEAAAECLVDIVGGFSLPGGETLVKDLAGNSRVFAAAYSSVTCASFLGVAGGGASHRSTSSELSESSNVTTSLCLCSFCWTGTSRGTSPAGAALLSELLLEDLASSRSD